MTVPNMITAAGIVSVGLYVGAFLSEANRWVIFTFVFLAGLSDALDGYFARRLDQVTDIGKIIDPLRDRLLLIAILVHVIWLVNFKPIVVGIAFFEIVVALAFLFALSKKIFLKVHWVGKMRQLIHVVCGGLIIAKYYFIDIINILAPWLIKIPIDYFLFLMFAASGLVAVIYTVLQINDVHDE